MQSNDLERGVVKVPANVLLRRFSFAATANLLRTGATFLSLMVISRQLGPASFGLYAFCMTVITFLNQLADSGLGIGVVRFIGSPEVSSDSERARLIWQLLLIRIASTIALSTAFIFFGQSAMKWLGTQNINELILVISVGVVSTSVFSFCLSVHQAINDFRAYFFISALASLLTATSTAMIFFLKIGTVSLAIQLQVAGLLICAGTSIASILPRIRQFDGPWFHRFASDLDRFSQFTQWTTVAALISIVLVNLDILLVSRALGGAGAGEYIAAQRTAYMGTIMSGAVSTVALSHVSQMRDEGELRRYRERVLSYLPKVVIGIVVAILISHPLFSLLFGSQYTRSSEIFPFLLIAYGLGVITNPLSYVVYALDMPRVIAVSQAIQVLIIGLLGTFLLYLWGPVGLAISVLASRIFSFVFINWTVDGLIRRVRALG